MNINLHIERLVLDGLPLAGAHAAAIRAAVETELGRRLGEAGLPGMSGGGGRKLSGGQIQWSRETTPDQTGHQIADAVHSALTSQRTNGKPGRGSR